MYLTHLDRAPTWSAPIARKRSPETLEKRRRALAKQQKRDAKLTERIARNEEKKTGEKEEYSTDGLDPFTDPNAPPIEEDKKRDAP